MKTGQLTVTSNRFTPLSNLDDRQIDLLSLQSDSEWSSLTQINHKIDTQHSAGTKIPTIINGRIRNSEVTNHTRPKVKSTSVPNNKFCKLTYKGKIIGDNHLKENAIRTNQCLNTKFAVSSLTKPGATTNQLVYSQETAYKDLG